MEKHKKLFLPGIVITIIVCIAAISWYSYTIFVEQNPTKFNIFFLIYWVVLLIVNLVNFLRLNS